MKNVFKRPVPSNVQQKLAFLLKSQYWETDKILEYQFNKIKILVRHAYENVPYYRKMFLDRKIVPDDIKSFSDFSCLPIMTKKNLQDSFNELSEAGIDTSNLVVNSTGGSTGTPLNFYQDKEYENWADAARIRAWSYFPGGNLGSLEAVFWGAIRDVGKGFSIIRAFREIVRDGVLALNTFDLDEKLLIKYIYWYNRFKPSLLRGYATSLYYVAEYIEKNNLTIHRPKAIVSSTEVLHKRMREKIETVFAAPVFDSYGCREISQMATECEQHNGFHVVFENQYVELINQEVVVTNLHNFVMPFIRYKVGDLAKELSWEPCPCGRQSPRLINLIGRDNDNIELPNGKVINGEFFEFLFFGMNDVIQYQVTYSRSGKKMVVKLKLRKGSSIELAQQTILQTMEGKFNFENVEIISTEQFDKTPTGKLRFVYMTE